MRTMQTIALAGVIAAAGAAPAFAQQGGITVEIAVGRSIADRMPVDTASAFPADVGTLVCWTKVTGAAGQKVTHVWTHGEHTWSIDLDIGGSPWRTHSEKTVPPSWTGEWTVEVKDSTGKVLATRKFTVGS